MKKEFQIKLDFPPSVNSNWQYARGNVFVRRNARNYKLKVLSLVKEKYPDFVPFDKPIMYEAIYYEPNKKIRDLDNLKKVLWDSLKFSKVIKDDSLFKKESTEMKFSKEIRNCVFIRISEI